MRWKQGSDTCVFKPSVGCQDGAAPGNLPGMISRVVEEGSIDVETESRLKESFPDLAKRGLITVYTQACTPAFSTTNLNWGEMLSHSGACDLKSPHDTYTNLITTEYTNDYYSFVRGKGLGGIKIGPERGLELLRGALCAAVALVPDNGTWGIHGDLHLGNVLIKQDLDSKDRASQSYTSLADWGRSLTFDSTSMDSVFTALHKYLHIQKYAWDDSFESFEDMANEEGVRTGQYLQYSGGVFLRLHVFHKKYIRGGRGLTKAVFQDALGALRGWMVYVLLKQYYKVYGIPYPSWIAAVVTQKSQAGLIAHLNANLPKIAGEDYYSERFLENRPLPVVPSPIPAINLGGGKRKTKRNLKRKQRTLRKRI
jgi:hypothetical protein